MRHTLAALVMLCPTSGFCQTNSDTILGTLEDSNGYILPNAVVSIENAGPQFSQTLKTNSAGAFTSPFAFAGLVLCSCECARI